MITVLSSLFLLALLAPWATRALRAATGWVLALPVAAAALYFAQQAPGIAAGADVVARLSWVPSLGLELAFRLDGLSLLFALLVAGTATVIFIYAQGYLGGDARLGRFYAALLTFTGAMLGVVLADNLIALFVFWELTSISSYLLIGFNHENPAARRAALQALLITGGGGLALMAGFLLLGSAAGTWDLHAIVAGGSLAGDPLYVPLFVLVLLGAATKSAQVPFHFWLPGAMAAPTPVSAFLHSATMVKAGIYLLARLHPALGGTELWTVCLMALGGLTFVAGAVIAFGQHDLKRVLALSTVSMLGAMVMLLGVGSPAALLAALALLLAHALYKASLFMVAGTVDHETGTRDLRQLGGLARAMPILTVLAALAALGKAGMAPFFGFVAKELALEASLASPHAVLLVAAIVVGGALLTALAWLTGAQPFWTARPVDSTARADAHEAPLALWLGPAVLAPLGLLFGLWPSLPATWLLAPAVAVVAGTPVAVELSLWHGLNPALALSLAALAAGLLLVRYRPAVLAATAWMKHLPRVGPERIYDRLLAALPTVAAATTRVLQSGSQRHYMLTIFGFLTGLAWWGLLTVGGIEHPVGLAQVRFYEAGVGVLILAGALIAVFSRTVLATVAALGVVGYGVALVYVLFGAPDLAITQFLVETLTVLLFVLCVRRLPRFSEARRGWTRARDGALAIAFGALMGVLVLKAGAIQLHPTISGFFADNSVALGHGRNIVNVILVDFRALDTLGEIVVLAVAAVSIFALLKLRPDRQPGAGMRAAADGPAAVGDAASHAAPAREAG